MKIALIVLGLACLISASPLPSEEETENAPQVYPDFQEVRPTRPPQLHDNAVALQGPLAGRLLNVVQNFQGRQKTDQQNGIRYDVGFFKALRELLDEPQYRELEQAQE